MSTKILILMAILGLSCTSEHIGGKKSIIPRHSSEKDVLFHIAKPTESLHKRTNVGTAFDSGVLHTLENFLLKKVDELGLSVKKSEIEDQKEVETIAENLDAKVSASELRQGGKDGTKGEEKDRVMTKEELANESKKKSVVTKEESRPETRNGKSEEKTEEDSKSKFGDSEKEKSKEKLQPSKIEEKNERDDDKSAKTVVRKILEPAKMKEIVEEQATKRDQTVPDEDAEYGRLGLSIIDPCSTCCLIYAF